MNLDRPIEPEYSGDWRSFDAYWRPNWNNFRYERIFLELTSIIFSATSSSNFNCGKDRIFLLYFGEKYFNCQLWDNRLGMHHVLTQDFQSSKWRRPCHFRLILLHHIKNYPEIAKPTSESEGNEFTGFYGKIQRQNPLLASVLRVSGHFFFWN